MREEGSKWQVMGLTVVSVVTSHDFHVSCQLIAE